MAGSSWLTAIAACHCFRLIFSAARGPWVRRTPKGALNGRSTEKVKRLVVLFRSWWWWWCLWVSTPPLSSRSSWEDGGGKQYCSDVHPTLNLGWLSLFHSRAYGHLQRFGRSMRALPRHRLQHAMTKTRAKMMTVLRASTNPAPSSSHAKEREMDDMTRHCEMWYLPVYVCVCVLFSISLFFSLVCVWIDWLRIAKNKERKWATTYILRRRWLEDQVKWTKEWKKKRNKCTHISLLFKQEQDPTSADNRRAQKIETRYFWFYFFWYCWKFFVAAKKMNRRKMYENIFWYLTSVHSTLTLCFNFYVVCFAGYFCSEETTKSIWKKKVYKIKCGIVAADSVKLQKQKHRRRVPVTQKRRKKTLCTKKILSVKTKTKTRR